MDSTIPKKYLNRVAHKCGKCGSTRVEVIEGSRIGSLPGTYHNVCNGCGWSRAITFRAPKGKVGQ